MQYFIYIIKKYYYMLYKLRYQIENYFDHININ